MPWKSALSIFQLVVVVVGSLFLPLLPASTSAPCHLQKFWLTSAPKAVLNTIHGDLDNGSATEHSCTSLCGGTDWVNLQHQLDTRWQSQSTKIDIFVFLPKRRHTQNLQTTALCSQVRLSKSKRPVVLSSGVVDSPQPNQTQSGP